jgi:transcriptional regulator with XRE-family HTH domain
LYALVKSTNIVLRIRKQLMSFFEETNTPKVGQAIRSIREGQKLSLRDLSDLCGLSINAISKIEREEASPTVASLHKLASALGVHIIYFFTEKPNEITSYTPRHKTMRIQGDGLLIEGLGSGIPNQKLEPFRMSIGPGVGTTSDPVSHSGEEFVHCFDGELEFIVGNQKYLLRSGDSLLFKASQPHSWHNNSPKAAKIIMVFEIDQTQSLPHRLLNESVMIDTNLATTT